MSLRRPTNLENLPKLHQLFRTELVLLFFLLPPGLEDRRYGPRELGHRLRDGARDGPVRLGAVVPLRPAPPARGRGRRRRSGWAAARHSHFRPLPWLRRRWGEPRARGRARAGAGGWTAAQARLGTASPSKGGGS